MPTALIDAISAVTKPVREAQGLPNGAYTDPEIFRFERDHILAHTWAGITFGSELPAPGCARPVNFMGMPLLAVRDRNGSLRVFHNVCSHRGMVLVDEPVRVKTALRCPYHSWSYDLEGRLLGTPHIGGMDKHSCEGFERSVHGLREIRSAIWMDIIFVNLSGDAEEFDSFLAPLLKRWKPFVGAAGFDELVVPPSGGRAEFAVACNWKLAVENFCEAYHLPWVHPALNADSPLDQHYNILDGERISGQGSLKYRPANVSSEKLPQFASWPADRPSQAEYISFYPNVLLGLQADHAFAVILLPQSEGNTLERLQLSYVGATAADDRYAPCRESVLRNWDIVFSEDISAVEGLQRGRQSPGFDGGIFTPVQDTPTHHFHSWVASAYKLALK